MQPNDGNAVFTAGETAQLTTSMLWGGGGGRAAGAGGRTERWGRYKPDSVYSAAAKEELPERFEKPELTKG